MSELCTVCGLPIEIGQFPCVYTPRPHAKALPSKGYEARFDDGLGCEVTGWGDVHQKMREHHLDYREHPSKGELSARRDRIEARKVGPR